MTIPTNNLYDFVHQATKRKFWLKYFYPWGSRTFENLTEFGHTSQVLDLLDWSDITKTRFYTFAKPYIKNDITIIKSLMPVLMCHDQEPLNFDQYVDTSPLMEKYWNETDYIKNASFKHSNFSLQKKWVLLHSELNSPELDHYEKTGFYKGAYWWSHACISRDWYRYAEHDQLLDISVEFDKKKMFLIYCRDCTGSREYRNKFLKICNDKNLLDDIHGINFSADPDLSASYEWKDFVNTNISVVLETVFDSRIHLTEKTLRPIACGHPFILANGPGSLQLLRDYGFKTFSPFINEDYDTIKDNHRRLQSITEEMHRLRNLSTTEKRNLTKNCKEIAHFNKNHFFSKEFLNLIKDELSSNVERAYQSLDNNLVKELQCWWEIRSCKRKNNLALNKTPRSAFLLKTLRSMRKNSSL